MSIKFTLPFWANLLIMDGYNLMRRNALSLVCISIGMGAVLSFCRWLQNQIAFDDDGLLVSSSLNWTIALLMIGSCVWYYFIIRGMKNSGFNQHADFKTAFSEGSKNFMIIVWIFGILMALGGLIYLFSSIDVSNSGLDMIYGILCIISGIAIPMAFSPLTSSSSKGTIAFLMTIPIIQLCFGLLGCYKLNSTNPTIWEYAPEILAFSATLLTYYYVAGFAYGRSFTLRAFFFAMTSITFNICCIADDLNFGQVIIILTTVGIFALMLWRMFLNLSDPDNKKFTKADNLVNPIIEESKKLSVAPPQRKEDYSVEDILKETDKKQ